MLRHLHRNLVHFRRVSVLAKHLARLLPNATSVLDVGSGDGRLAAALLGLRPDLQLHAIDTTLRTNTLVPTRHYDGQTFPFEDKSFDVVMMIDVLHHVDDIDAILSEATRVSRNHILIKDHFVQGWMARPTLVLMDNVGNRQFGIAIPANYQSPSQWDAIYARHYLHSEKRLDRLGLYFPPLSWIFERRLHFINLLRLESLN